ncbi:MAG: YcxB family protein [Clostridia bacterium]|nr:YcxB family protein [Oscillospiraceae bacterium]MBQ1955776.1 YcxB family protein [Clostridia bacterium]
MQYKLDVELTDKDYLEFNLFQTFKSAVGKKNIRKSRVIFLAAIAALALLVVVLRGFTTSGLIYLGLLAVLTVVYMILFKRIMAASLVKQLKALKKSGKLPFDPKSEIEFFDDKFIESAKTNRNERSYDSIEKICIYGDKYIYLFTSVASAYILPVPLVKKQVNYNAFVKFLSQKCSATEQYKA